MTILSQRDERWADMPLGTKGTIGQYGCLISCIAMLCNLDPLEVNARLMSVKGYSQGNLVIWSKLSEAIPGLSYIKRSNVYNNDEVKANLPCLVEVDGKRIGGDKHWVLYIGDQQMFDPWYGNQKTTSFYPPVGYTIVKYTPIVNAGVDGVPPVVRAMNDTLCDLSSLGKEPDGNKYKVETWGTVLSKIGAKDGAIKSLTDENTKLKIQLTKLTPETAPYASDSQIVSGKFDTTLSPSIRSRLRDWWVNLSAQVGKYVNS